MAKQKKTAPPVVFQPSKGKSTAETILSNVRNVAKQEQKPVEKDFLEFSPQISEKDGLPISVIKTQVQLDDSLNLEDDDDEFDGNIVQENKSLYNSMMMMPVASVCAGQKTSSQRLERRLDAFVQQSVVAIPLESLSLNRPAQELQSREQHFNNISGINGASGTKAHEKENDCLFEDKRQSSSTQKKNCLVKLGKKAMRKMRENQQKKAAQNDENQVLPQLTSVKQQPSSSLSFVGISKRNRF